MSKAEQFANQWMMHRSVLLDILDRVDDKNFDFRPWSKAMTLGELAQHIAGAGALFINTAKTGQFSRPEGQPVVTSMAELRQFLKDSTDSGYATIKSMTDEEFDGPVTSEHILPDGTPASVWLSAMKDHEVHHKGQMFVYARMTGVEEMPNFVQH
ncbi:DinB family protein [Alicyclobacillus sp. SO9]|uniref:DinB family protein n=1 Tax=Alicyclobacillus sp. SO9 TaxID=2665646 RepID=UPI0018E84A84|nr:DinB family protein [Alicyclobacillus sp. SO9]QQE80208.1 DinB family protein [Alicyclobacillus sp. SO9]